VSRDGTHAGAGETAAPVREFEVEAVGPVRAELGEGPCWDARTGSLLWVDIDGGDVHRTDPRTGHTETTRVGAPVSAVLPDASGELAVLRRDRLVRLSPERTVAAIDAPEQVRFNDAKCDPAGRLWAGTMHAQRAPSGAALYRLDAGGLTRVLDATVSNGLGWSPDGRRMYYADTPLLRVDVFDYDPGTGEASGRRPFADLDGTGGRPDGLTVDSEGCVWVAAVRGGALRRYAPDGTPDMVVPLPVSHPTSCAFGGPAGRDLYVTTARALLTDGQRAEQPLAGRLLRLRPGPSGPPATAWAG
jgi:sugar lactone lactonase YvrE